MQSKRRHEKEDTARETGWMRVHLHESTACKHQPLGTDSELLKKKIADFEFFITRSKPKFKGKCE